MTFASLLLVVLASLVHATWNLLAKRAAAVGPVFVFAYNLVACVAYAPWVAYLVIAGRGTAWTGVGAAFVLLSALIHLGYSLCLQRGYQVADLSVVYPVARGTGPMLSTIGAFLILDGLGIHIPKGYIYAAMGFSALVECLNLWAKKRAAQRLTAD